MLDSHLLTSSHCGTGFIRSIFPGRACAGHCTAHHPMPCGQLARAAAISSTVGLAQDLILGHRSWAADAVAGHSGRPRDGSPRLTPRTIRLWSNDETPSRAAWSWRPTLSPPAWSPRGTENEHETKAGWSRRCGVLGPEGRALRAGARAGERSAHDKLGRRSLLPSGQVWLTMEKRNAVVRPNSSIPFSASRAPISLQ